MTEGERVIFAERQRVGRLTDEYESRVRKLRNRLDHVAYMVGFGQTEIGGPDGIQPLIEGWNTWAADEA